MSELALGVASALWLGLLTSISPCPLATNVAAISFLGRRVDRPRSVLSGGLLYSLGRTLAYVALGALVIAGLLSIPQTSRFLQRFMNQLIGPVLILAGIVLLGRLRLPLPGLGKAGERAQHRFADGGLWGALLLGALFALSFCPISAALFFGSLVPLALRVESPLLVPAVYGLGTALPVVGFALLVAFGAHYAAVALDRLAVVERWARRVTGFVFIGVGVYMTLAFTLEVLP